MRSDATLTENLNNIASRIQLENVPLMREIQEAARLGDNAQVKDKLWRLADNEDMRDGTETLIAEFIRDVAAGL
jgi:hypothetical protein